MTSYITKNVQVILKCVFKEILGYLLDWNEVLNFYGILLDFVWIMPDNVILDQIW